MRAVFIIWLNLDMIDEKNMLMCPITTGTTANLIERRIQNKKVDDWDRSP